MSQLFSIEHGWRAPARVGTVLRFRKGLVFHRSETISARYFQEGFSKRSFKAELIQPGTNPRFLSSKRFIWQCHGRHTKVFVIIGGLVTPV